MADFDRESMMEMFTFEMSQLLEQLEQTIIAGEAGYSMDQINEIFRIMHTIKGSAAMMLFTSISSAAHAIEDLFFYLREENPTDIDFSKLTDYVLEGMDFIKEELIKIENKEPADGDPAAISQAIKDFLQEIKLKAGGAATQVQTKSTTVASTNASETKPSATTQVPNAQQNHIGKGAFWYKAKITFEDGCEMENIRAFTLINNIKPYVDDVTHVPEDVINEASIETIRNNGFLLEFSSDLPFVEMERLLIQTIYLKDLELEEIKPASQTQDKEAADKKEFAKEPLHHYEAVLWFDEGSEMENIRAFAVVHNVKVFAKTLSHVPEDLLAESSIAYIRANGFQLQITSTMAYDKLYAHLSSTLFLKDIILNEIDANIGQAEKPQTQTENNETKKSETSAEASMPENEKPKPSKEVPQANSVQSKKTAGQTVISVNVSKLDQLLKFMGELVIAEAMVTQNPELEALDLESFRKEARQLRKIIKDLQETVMSMRMVPLSTTFFKMNRIVRDMCKQLNKDVQLDILGEETEVDKNIIEHISDPLMHIIRNSVDHGIEMPDKRLAVGKPSKGVVTLEAKNSGSDVLIVVRDDGAGLNKDKIMKKARQNGLLRKDESEYTDKEIFQFVFMPGFSTNEQVTSFSGRGVGMDVVSKNLEIVGGTVIVDSVAGEGSSFTLKIPLTLAIIEGMIIKMGEAKYTIPIVSIKDSFRPKMEDVFTDPSGNEMITVRGECYNVVRLYEFFGVESAVTNLEEGIMMSIENGDETVCLFVDELVGEQQVVVKNMPKYIKKVDGISGCTLLGNGDISLIIDVVGFFDK